MHVKKYLGRILKYFCNKIFFSQRSWVVVVLTGMQLEKQLDFEVVELAAVLDDLDERSQATLA